MPPDQTSHSPFPTTHWTLIDVAQCGSPEDAARAMEAICAHYWYPIYAFLRRSGYTAHDAEDLTQAFFERVVGEDAIRSVQRAQGKLRSYWLGVLKRVVADHLRHKSAEKRGGARAHVSFDQMAAEERYRLEPEDAKDPEWLFSRTWANELFVSVQAKLRRAYAQTEHGEEFEVLLPFLSCDAAPPSQRDVARRLGISETGAGVMIFRLREKFRALLREEIAKTALTAEDISAEMAWLHSMLSAP